MPILNKYFTQAGVVDAPTPKFIYLSGTDITIQSLLYLFGEKTKY